MVRFNTIPKRWIPTMEEALLMVEELQKSLPLTKEQIICKAIRKYYLAKQERFAIGPALRSHLLIKQNHQCFYCQKYLTHSMATVEHRTPLARGGESVPENLCVTCEPCNQLKATMTEKEFLAFRNQEELCVV